MMLTARSCTCCMWLHTGRPSHGAGTSRICTPEVERDIASARQLIAQIDTTTGDRSIRLSSNLRQQLVEARMQLSARVERAQMALDAARTLNREFSSRLKGIQLQPGRLVTDSLAIQGQQSGNAIPLLPDDPRFAGLLTELNQLPVRPGQKAAPLNAMVAADPLPPNPGTPIMGPLPPNPGKPIMADEGPTVVTAVSEGPETSSRWSWTLTAEQRQAILNASQRAADTAKGDLAGRHSCRSFRRDACRWLTEEWLRKYSSRDHPEAVRWMTTC
jgi:hypothetical protein